jgi:predicted DNA-binding protein
LNVSLTDEAFDKLCDLSRESGKSLSALVREIVSEHLKAEGYVMLEGKR